MASIKKYLAEFIGTFVLVFMGCGSAVLLGCDPNGGHLAVAFAFGLSIVAMAYTIGGISGCHINPAVSLAMLLNKKLSIFDFVGYVISQILGAIAAAGLLRYFVEFMVDQTGGLGSNGLVAGDDIIASLVIEVVLTFIFVLVILGVTSDESKSAISGLVIGLTLTFVHIVGIPLTGTSVNPARSIGPALIAIFDGNTNAIESLWVFIAAPLVGAALAVVVFKLIKTSKAKA